MIVWDVTLQISMSSKAQKIRHTSYAVVGLNLNSEISIMTIAQNWIFSNKKNFYHLLEKIKEKGITYRKARFPTKRSDSVTLFIKFTRTK